MKRSFMGSEDGRTVHLSLRIKLRMVQYITQNTYDQMIADATDESRTGEPFIKHCKLTIHCFLCY